MSVSTIASLVLANTTTNAGTITLPPANQIPGRVITFKDSGGNFVNKALTLVVAGTDTFEDGTTTKTLRETYGTVQVAASGTKWFIISGTQVNTLAASTIKTAALSTINISSATATLSSIGLTNAQGSTLSMYQASTFLYFNNFIVAGARVGVGQMFYPIVPTVFTTTTFTYTGSDQTFAVPQATTSVTVYMWGAGGGGGPGATGGAGAYITGTLTVPPGRTLTIVVGQGGLYNSTATMYGGGGAGPTIGTINGGCGGGRSAIIYNSTEIVDVGGGGGASGGAPGGQTSGYATYTGTAASGNGGSYGGQGATQSAGGAAGVNSGFTNSATAGSSLQGGKAADYCGGGGGGYYGGGGGAGTNGYTAYSGGGGSSYTTNPAFSLISGSNSPNLAYNPPGTSVFYYVSGVAAGGNGAVNGGNGLVVLTYYK